VEWRIEVVLVPVSDLDRATAFYRDQVGFTEDFDTHFGDDVRMLQLTPEGSGCSIALIDRSWYPTSRRRGARARR
jgi:catechol 2,3-dioxygenase-like lactoylglutathione lyase family enzyme